MLIFKVVVFDAQQECFMEVGYGRLYVNGREKKRDCNLGFGEGTTRRRIKGQNGNFTCV